MTKTKLKPTRTWQVDNSGKERTSYSSAWVCSEREIEIGIMPVLFGFRIRVGTLDSQPFLDWCVGRDSECMKMYLAILLYVLSFKEKGVYLGEWINEVGLPAISEIKPIFNDEEFQAKVIAIANRFEEASNA